MFARQGLLAGDRLVAALEDTGDRVFRTGSWSHENVRGAGYDLRIATDLMVVPTKEGYRVYEQGVHRRTEVILAPGETALFSTSERVSLDWNIAGNLGAKFSLLARGLMILTGLAVDPGYGRVTGPDGDWVPSSDTRLNFLVANVGSDPVSLRPGNDSIAVLQLFEVSAVTVKRDVASEGFDALKERLFTDSGDGTGLAYFQSVLSVRSKLASLEQRIESLDQTVARVQNASNALVSLGVYLVSTTILAAIAAFLIETVPGALEAAEGDSLIIWLIIAIVSLSMVAVSIAAGVSILKSIVAPAGGGSNANQ